MEDENNPEDSPDWTPEKDKKNDPVEIAKKQLALGQKFLKKIEEEEERQKARAAAPAVRGYLTAPSHPHFPPAPQVSTFVVRHIKNGFLVVGSGNYQYDPDPDGGALYCKDKAAVREAVKGILDAFLTQSTPGEGPELPPGVGSDVPDGT